MTGNSNGAHTEVIHSRTPWQGDPESLARIKTAGKINDEGYVNVADQLGLSGERGEFLILLCRESVRQLTRSARVLDYSTYHPFWVRRQFGGYY